MERNKSKLIMFDYGGIVEEYSTESRRVYDHRDVIADAVIYACGLTIPNCCDADEWRMKLYRSITTHPYTTREFTGWDSKEERDASLIKALREVSGEPLPYEEETINSYLRYLESHNILVPFRKKMVNLEAATGKRCLIGSMTNIGPTWSPLFNTITKDIGYDYVFESYRERLMKPDPMAYAWVEEASGLSGEQILLIDDCHDNVQAAIEYGWCAFWASLDHSTEQIKSVIDDFINDNEDAWPYLTTVPVKV